MTDKNTKAVPSVSIGMPVYNGEKYIREALDSLLSQTFTDFELIISDNCSTDNTSQICKEFVAKDPRVKYIRQEKNIGPNANFEFVLERAEGEFFMWAACDDRWTNNFVDKLVKVLKSDINIGLAFSNFLIMNLQTGEKKSVSVKTRDSDSNLVNYLTAIYNMCPSLIYGLYRKSLIQHTKFESFDFADVSFITEIGLRSKIVVLDDFLYIAGTKGDRIPYSLSSGKIKRLPFLRTQFHTLNKYFSFPKREFLFICTLIFMAYNKLRLWRY